MKAALLEAPGQPLRVRDITIAEPGPGQVRVRVRHCGVCHSDLSIVDGTFPSPLPIVLGHEAAGEVDAIGPGVAGLRVGDHVVLTPCPPCGTCYWCVRGEPTVCVNASAIQTNTFPDGSTGLALDGQVVYRGVGLGAFAEYVVTPATGAVKIPADVPLDVACVIGCAVQTGVGAVLNTACVEEGATVLVMGLGGIGLSIVQGARLAGAARIIVSDPVAERRATAERFGATDQIDPTAEDVVARVMELTGVGVDYAFDAVGRAQPDPDRARRRRAPAARPSASARRRWTMWSPSRCRHSSSSARRSYSAARSAARTRCARFHAWLHSGRPAASTSKASSPRAARSPRSTPRWAT